MQLVTYKLANTIGEVPSDKEDLSRADFSERGVRLKELEVLGSIMEGAVEIFKSIEKAALEEEKSANAEEVSSLSGNALSAEKTEIF